MCECVGVHSCVVCCSDLSLISQRLESGTYYKSLELLNKELTLMLDNCRAYNKPGTTYYKYAPVLPMSRGVVW